VPTPSVKDPSKITADKKKDVEKWEYKDQAAQYLLS
jgi:hypothetical protein